MVNIIEQAKLLEGFMAYASGVLSCPYLLTHNNVNELQNRLLLMSQQAAVGRQFIKVIKSASAQSNFESDIKN